MSILRELRLNDLRDRRKELVADALKHQRNVNAVAKHITTQLEQVEGHLQQEEDKIARAKEEARRAQLRIEEERINRERQEAIAKALAEEKAKLQAKEAPENFHTAGPDPLPAGGLKAGAVIVEGKDLGFTFEGLAAPAQDQLQEETDAVEGVHVEPSEDGAPAPEPDLFPHHEVAQESDATKILHRCDLIVENLSDMEAFQSKDSRVLWEGFASDVGERVAQLRKHVAQYLTTSKPYP